MLTLDELRSAVTAADPLISLQAIARRELNAGRTREQVSEAIADLLPELRTLPEYADKWEDPIAEVIDRLTDWTHPSSQLQPETQTGETNGPQSGTAGPRTRRTG